MKFCANVLFEDNHILAVDKPAGMLTQSAGQESGLEDLLRQNYRYLHCVHRIDAPVSGIVIFAKSSKGLSRMSESLKEGKWTKIYRARVEGKLKGASTLEHRLVHGDHRAEIAPDGKVAKLNYRVLQSDEASLVEIELLTGRYHQIRAQFAAIGHPIIGDTKYGAATKAARGKGTIDLHHTQVNLPHPTLKSDIEIKALMPQMLRL
ncbi:MAG: RluA family pseudouridine synthase [Chlamydiia bacterium]|nr:RluA family pseudouridine synthase [Chlamydiia bacterium]